MSTASDWKTLVDPRSNKLYYVNMLTKKTTWTNPFAPQTEDWVQYTDAKGRNYYMNRMLRTSTWTKPAGFDEDALRYATKKKGKEDSGSTESKKGSSKTTDAKNVWTKHLDPNTKFPYWTDAEGNMSTIDPTLMDSEAVVRTADSAADDTTANPDEEEVWTVPLTTKHADNATQQEKIDTLMKKIEGGVVKDIAEITDFSAKKLQEHIDSIQSIVKRKRTSYFIEKSLKFIEEIVERKDPSVLRAMSDSYAMRTFMSVLALPRKPTTVEALLRVLLKASKNFDEFAQKLRLEGQFWDTVFNCIKIASGNDAECFVEVYTHDEARDIPTPRHSSRSDVEAYQEAAKKSIGEHLTEQDAASMNQSARYSLELVDHFLADPMVTTFVREYRAIRDIVECCRSHEAHVCTAASGVLSRFVEKKSAKEPPFLRPLVEGRYSMEELLLMIHSKSRDLVTAALDDLLRRARISAFPPLDEMCGGGSAVVSQGISVSGTINGRKVSVSDAAAVVSEKCLYVYERNRMNDAASTVLDRPVLKIGLEGVKVDVANRANDRAPWDVRVQRSGKDCQFDVEIRVRVHPGAALTDFQREWIDSVKSAAKSRTFRALKPVSSIGSAALRSIRIRSRRKREERQRVAKKKAEAKAAVPKLGKAPSRSGKRRGLTRAVSRLKQPVGPTYDERAPAFDVAACSAAPVTSKRPQFLVANMDLSEAIRWSDIGPQVTQLLFFAKKFSAFSGRADHAVSALKCVEIAPSATGNVDTMTNARIAIFTETEYEFLDSLAVVVKNARAVFAEEKTSGRSAAIEIMAHAVRCIMVVLSAGYLKRGGSKQLAGIAKAFDDALKKTNDEKRGLGDLLAQVAMSGNADFLLTTLLCARSLSVAGHTDPLRDSKMNQDDLQSAFHKAEASSTSASTKEAVRESWRSLLNSTTRPVAKTAGTGKSSMRRSLSETRKGKQGKSCTVM